MANDFIYDYVPYPGYTFSQTHPERIAILAGIHGINTADPENCRVLELGCGNGANLLWIATTLPASNLVGVDLSKVHIDTANKGAEELGLDNVSFVQADVMKFSRDRFGEFDFIIAHGLYSWVPEFVREKVLDIYAECLAPNGIGYLSYNAYPGCHIREMVSEMMKFHTAECDDPVQKARQGKALLHFITNSAEENSIYRSVLQSELDLIQDRSESGLFHDDLAEVNKPFYFLEFAGGLAEHGLQYVCEAKFSSTHSGSLIPEAVKILDSLGSDYLRREQYMDFIVGRRFRSTLFCHNNVKVERSSNPSILDHLFIFGQMSCDAEPEMISSEEAVKFTAKDGSSIQTNHPFTKTALYELTTSGLIGIHYTELMSRCSGVLASMSKPATAEDFRNTSEFLIEMYKSGMVHLRRDQPVFAREPGLFPEASPFARWQVRQGGDVVRTLAGINIEPKGNHVLTLLALLDGTRDREALADEMTKLFEAEGVNRAEFESELPGSIEKVLGQLTDLALLVK